MSKLLEQINKTKRKEVTLADIAIRIGDGLHGTPQYDDNGEFYFINGNNLDNGHISIKKETRRIGESEYLKYKKDLGTETLLLSINGTIGNLAKYRGEKCILGKSACYINVKKEFVLDYLYYVLLDQRFQKHIDSNANGSTIKNVSLGQLRDYTFYIPDFDTQEKIASILNTYDSKIENNNRIIKNLELNAQTIFNEWFVNLKFPGYEKVKMVESEMGEIPEGWDVGKISGVGDVVCGKTPSKSQPEYFNGEFPFIKIPDMHGQMFILKTEDSLTQEGVDTQKNKLVPEDSICVSCIATVGLVSITTKDSQTNQQINTVIPKNKEFTEYLYFVLKNMKSDLQAIGSGGSTTLNVNTSVFSDLEVLIPDNGVMKVFHKKISPFFNQTKQLLKENISLKESRDQLLAKLI